MATVAPVAGEVGPDTGPAGTHSRRRGRPGWRLDAERAAKTGLLVGAAVAALLLPLSLTASGSAPDGRGESRGNVLTSQWPTPADGNGSRALQPSAESREVADWIAGAADHGNHAFIIVDKRQAVLHVFDAQARRTASTAVLLGAALGDHSVPGIGTRSISDIQLAERTTPAGRFVSERGRNTGGEDVIWVDYDAAVSMHRVRLNSAVEQRARRLATPTAGDNRISYGCINVPAAFYDMHIQPVFAARRALVYVLPDVGSTREVFGALAARAPR